MLPQLKNRSLTYSQYKSQMVWCLYPLSEPRIPACRAVKRVACVWACYQMQMQASTQHLRLRRNQCAATRMIPIAHAPARDSTRCPANGMVLLEIDAPLSLSLISLPTITFRNSPFFPSSSFLTHLSHYGASQKCVLISSQID